jgi:hypothetical protein
MGKYANLESDIFSIFSNATWTATTIKTYPQNFIAVSPGNEFIRLNIVPSGNGVNINSVSGILMIDIFVESGKGSKRAFQIADILDSFIKGKTLKTNSNNATQFQSSAIQSIGVDTENHSLYRVNYTIPFQYYGVI